MTKMTAAFALSVCFALSIPLPATAQPDQGQGQGPSLADLHNALRLSPDQEPAWRAFEQASSPDPQDERRHDDAFRRMETMRAPDRMDMSIQMMQSDLTMMQRRAGALRTFYGVLTPAQQAAFDRQTTPPRQQ